MIKPILIPHNETSSEITMYHDGNGNHCELSMNTHKLNYHTNQHIILIDTEAEIVEGDLSVDLLNMEIEITDKSTADMLKAGMLHNGNSKIISSTNKSHNLPQLSPQSIQLLINYYNKNKCMPESVEVETRIENEVLWHANGLSPEANNVGKPRIIKLNQQGEVDITIPEVKEKLYTEKEVIKLLDSFQDDLTMLGEIQGYNTKIWLNTKKK